MTPNPPDHPAARLHILGICGTFMGGLAALAREAGLAVEGSDQQVYPPMSTQLEQLGVRLHHGYAAAHLQPAPDLVVVGNALSRGNPAVEALLDGGLDYVSGPQWLAQQVLRRRPVLAVAGTHGKTTTSSLLAWILDQAGLAPGFLIGGVPQNFGISARLGAAAAPFVIEADEYDTAFFDKRAKFVHYRPQVALLNNLEFDHADIYADLGQIERQFHHLVRTVPGNGRLLVNGTDPNLARVLEMGCWTPVERFALHDEPAAAKCEWSAELLAADGSRLRLRQHGQPFAEIEWPLLGRHNAANAIAAVATAHAAGVAPEVAAAALAGFRPPRRRLEFLGSARGVSLHDDFAHHPTAIHTTLAGLRARIGPARLHAVLEPRSNSMRMGAHAAALPGALAGADRVWVLNRPELGWDAATTLAPLQQKLVVQPSTDALLAALADGVVAGDHVLFMSNGGFEAIQRRLLERLGG